MLISLKACVYLTLVIIACQADDKVTSSSDTKRKTSLSTAKPPNDKGYFVSIQDYERRKHTPPSPIAKVRVQNDTHVALTLEDLNNSTSLDKEKNVTADPVQFVILTQDDFRIVQLYPNASPMLVPHDPSLLFALYSFGGGPVLYDDLLLKHIQKQLNSNPGAFPTRLRQNLLSNYFDFVRDGYTNIQTALSLASYLDKEMDASNWGSFTLDFLQIYLKFPSGSDFGLLQKFISRKTEPLLTSIGVEEQISNSTNPSSSTSEGKLRGALLYWNCRTGSKICEDYAKKSFAKWKANPVDKPEQKLVPFGIPDLEPVLCKIMEVGGREAYDFAFEVYKNYSDVSLINRIGCLTDKALISDVFDKLLNTSVWKNSLDPVFALLNLGLNNPGSRKDILDFLSVNFDYVMDTLFKDIREAGFAKILEAVASGGTKTQTELAEIEKFVADHREKLSSQIKTLESVFSWTRENISWMDKNSKDISEWLFIQEDPQIKLRN